MAKTTSCLARLLHHSSRCQMKLPPIEPGFRKHTQHIWSMEKNGNRLSVGEEQPGSNHDDCGAYAV